MKIKDELPDDNYIGSDEEVGDEIEFQFCDKCDGHDACADFGCAIEAGLGHLVKRDPSFNW